MSYIQAINIVICIVAIGLTKASKPLNYRPGGKRMLIYGIYQNCPDNNTSDTIDNITPQAADVCRKNVELIASKKMKINDAMINFYNDDFKESPTLKSPGHLDWNMSDIEYKSIQVCSLTDLAAGVVELLMAEDNFIELKYGKIKENMWHGKRIYVKGSTTRFPRTRILALLMYADEVLSSTAVHLLANSHYPIYHLDMDWTPPQVDTLNLQKDHVFTEISILNDILNDVNEKLERVLRKKESFYFTVLYFNSENYFYKAKYKQFRSYFEQQSEFCFVVYEIQNFEEYNATIEEIALDTENKLILTFGDPQKQFLFFNKAISQGLGNLSWIFQDVNLNSYYPYGIPKSIKVGIICNSDRLYDYINGLETFSSSSTLPSNSLVLGDGTDRRHDKYMGTQFLCKLKMISLIDTFLIGLWRLTSQTRYVFYHLFHKKFRTYNRPLFKKKPLYDIYIRRNRGRVTYSYRFYKIKRNRTCTIPICQIGHQLQSLYNDSYYGPRCIQCPNKYYKDDDGNTECKPCPRYTVSTIGRDSCYDPYREHYPSLDQWSTRIAVTMNGCGGIFSLFALCVFLYQQDTPLVRAMDFKISIFHLTSLSLTFIFTPYLYIMKPVTSVCIVRPLCVSILNNLSVAFVIAKSQRLLKIFKSKMMVLSEGEMRRYNAYVGTGIFIICAIGQAFLFLPASRIYPRAIDVRVYKEMIKYIYCNTEDYINIQFGYLILLQLFTSFQAFRCRSLPGPFNEAMSIVYSTLIVIATYTATFPIYYFQPLESMKANVHFISLSVANLIPMLILYGNRLFIVVFKRKKNSKNYVRNRLWRFSREA